METLSVLPFRAPAKNDRDVIVDAIVFRMSAQVPFEPQAGWATSARGAGRELWTGEQEWCWAEGVVARITAVPEHELSKANKAAVPAKSLRLAFRRFWIHNQFILGFVAQEA